MMMMKTQIVIKMVDPPPIFYESGYPSFFCTSLHHRGIFGSFPKRKKHKNEKVHKNIKNRKTSKSVRKHKNKMSPPPSPLTKLLRKDLLSPPQKKQQQVK